MIVDTDNAQKGRTGRTIRGRVRARQDFIPSAAWGRTVRSLPVAALMAPRWRLGFGWWDALLTQQWHSAPRTRRDATSPSPPTPLPETGRGGSVVGWHVDPPVNWGATFARPYGT